ncbi:hypothetical protein LSH36_269g06016 [Paralvinella palmiformis]|uniref:Exosome complex component RRP46 n=1 Tax=Paralvinella palmiformis TaxID=53620 RepID=A0AAD9JLU1_9ANNE|nr:hypothetical protein LSH36_269g06016 [Paralvinella palmiformis]
MGRIKLLVFVGIINSMYLKEFDILEVNPERSSQQMRTITCECGILSRCDGSCCLCQGDTTIMASVNGPVEVKSSKECIDQAYIEVTYKPKVGLPGCPEKSLENFISSTCKSVISVNLHPRASFSIVLQEVENDGSLMSCCVNAACMALLNAAVPLNYMMAAVTIIVSEDGELVLDPTEKQQAAAVAYMMFVYSSKDFSLIASSSSGQYSDEQFQRCLLIGAESSKQVFKFYRDTMEKQLISKV